MIRQIHIWGVNDWLVDRTLDGFEGEDWRARPGGMSSALWILGHLDMERRWLGRVLGGDLPTDPEDVLFRPGTLPDDLPSDLDGAALRTAFHQAHQGFVAHLESLDETALAAAIEEEFPNSPKTKLGALQFMLMHESYHIGQLGALRVMLGKGPWMASV